MTFYGSSFIASHTGEKVAEADRSSETVLTADVRSGRRAPLPPGLGRVPRSAPRSVLPAPVARWTRLRLATFRKIWFLSTWRRPAATRPITASPRSASCASSGGAVVEEWSTLVNPECLIPAYIESFTGITNEMVAAAPRFADIAQLVLEKLGAATAARRRPRVFVAHNARFDYSFLRAEFRRADMHFSAKVLCTVKLSRRLFPEHLRHSLDAVMERHGLACSARHRALGDARVLSDFWLKLARRAPGAAARGGRAQPCSAAHKLPPHLPEDLADELPEGPGVYRFTEPDDELLYVGKSESLRARASSAHFADERTGSRERKLGRRCGASTGWRPPASSARCCARSNAIRSLRPLYNRHPKPASDGFTLQHRSRRAAPREISRDAPSSTRRSSTNCFGVFHSAKDARKALIEIAAAQRAVPQDARAGGRARGRASPTRWASARARASARSRSALHAVRVQMALSSLKLKAWPFPGRVALRERDAMGGVDLHVLDHWTYLGSARCEEELQRSPTRSAAPPPSMRTCTGSWCATSRTIRSSNGTISRRALARWDSTRLMSPDARRQCALLDRDGAGRRRLGARARSSRSSAPSTSASAATM